MKIILSALIFSMLASSADAAISTQSHSSADSAEFAMEILSMPEANRNLIAKAKAEELLPELVLISKTEKFGMSNRWKALTLAAYIGKDQALPELNLALDSKDWFMRNAALVALKNYHPLKAEIAARKLLKDKALVVRSAAVDVLGSQPNAQSRDLLWDELAAPYNYRGKQSLWIRQQILKQLAENPEPRETVLFVKALKEKDPAVYVSAVAALERLTHEKLGFKQQASQKKELWLQWAKAHPQFSVQ